MANYSAIASEPRDHDHDAMSASTGLLRGRRYAHHRRDMCVY